MGYSKEDFEGTTAFLSGAELVEHNKNEGAHPYLLQKINEAKAEGAELTKNKNKVMGYAGLDEKGKLSKSQIPILSSEHLGDGAVKKNKLSAELKEELEGFATKEEVDAEKLTRIDPEQMSGDESSAEYENSEDYLGTYAGVYMEYMGADGSWRTRLYRANDGATDENRQKSRIPITRSDGVLLIESANLKKSAVNQEYADDRYVRKFTEAADYEKVYTHTTEGKQSHRPLSRETLDNVMSIPLRDKTSQNFHVGDPTKDTHTVNKGYMEKYVEGLGLAKAEETANAVVKTVSGRECVTITDISPFIHPIRITVVTSVSGENVEIWQDDTLVYTIGGISGTFNLNWENYQGSASKLVFKATNQVTIIEVTYNADTSKVVDEINQNITSLNASAENAQNALEENQGAIEELADGQSELNKRIGTTNVKRAAQFLYYGDVNTENSADSAGAEALFHFGDGLNGSGLLAGAPEIMVLPGGYETVGSFENAASSGITTQIIIPNGVTVISDKAFINHTALNKVTIPKSVKTIGANAFSGCYNLFEVNYGGSPTDWAKISIGSGNEQILPESYCAIINYSCDYINEERLNNKTNHIEQYGKAVTPSDESWFNFELTDEGTYAVGLNLDVYGSANGDDKDIIVPYEYKGVPVTHVMAGGFQYATGWGDALVFPKSIKVFGEGALSFNSFTEFAFPEKTEKIGSNMFEYCTDLKTIHIPHSALKSPGIVEIDKILGSDLNNLTAVCVEGSPFEWDFSGGSYTDKIFFSNNYITYSMYEFIMDRIYTLEEDLGSLRESI